MKVQKTSSLILLSICVTTVFSQSDYIQNLPNIEAQISMILIPEGSFIMGSDKTEMGHFGDEGPQHEVTLDSFWIGQYEITWDLYNLFVSREMDQYQSSKTHKSEVNIDVDGVSGATTPYVEMSFGMGIDNYPAICMTQLAAVKFCEWLSAMTGNFYRLPTEAEWEYACRAGTTSAYSFGDDTDVIDQYAWFAENSNDKYQKVGKKLPNPWGLYDMHGNVAEWTLDQYIPTVYGTRKNKNKNPFEAPTKTYPITVRGGSWIDFPKRLRSAARRPSSKKWKRQDPQIPKSLWWHTDATFVGFRVVRPVNVPSSEEQKIYWNYELIN
jgi:formylglycine-generating enzyme required for sulfatase activity